jgi:hypothetical protein
VLVSISVLVSTSAVSSIGTANASSIDTLTIDKLYIVIWYILRVVIRLNVSVDKTLIVVIVVVIVSVHNDTTINTKVLDEQELVVVNGG